MELIKIDTDHFVVVDDSEIREGDWYIDDTKSIRQSITSDQSYWSKRKEYKKITHSTNIDWNDVYYIPLQEVKELIGEVDMEKKAEKHAQKMWGEYVGDVFTHNDIITDKTLGENTIYDFKSGYNQALEDNKEKKYTEEDLKYMFDCGRNYQNNAEITFKVSMEYLLQTKTSWQVEFVDGKLKLKGI